MSDDEKRTDMLPVFQNQVMLMPRFIEQETYLHMLVHVINHLKEPLYLFCDGFGGSVDHAFAIIDICKYHGDVSGILLGSALSAHAAVWAGCSKRYVFPHSSIGVHSVNWQGDSMLTVNHARYIHKTFTDAEKMNANLFAGVSNKTSNWWYKRITTTGASEFDVLYAEELIKLEMAKPSEELDRQWLTKALQLRKSKNSHSLNKS